MDLRTFEMDLRTFETWLSGIGTLTAPQRQRALRMLSLSDTAPLIRYRAIRYRAGP